MTTALTDYRDHLIGASDALRAASKAADLSTDTFNFAADLCSAGGLLLEAAGAIVKAEDENNSEALTLFQWSLLLLLSLAAEVPEELRPILNAARERPNDAPASWGWTN